MKKTDSILLKVLDAEKAITRMNATWEMAIVVVLFCISNLAMAQQGKKLGETEKFGVRIIATATTHGPEYQAVNTNKDSAYVKIIGVQKKFEELPGGIFVISGDSADANGNVKHPDFTIGLASGERRVLNHSFCIHTVGVKIYYKGILTKLIPLYNEYSLNSRGKIEK